MKKKINPIVQAIMESNEVENMADVQSLMKNLYKDMMSVLLESEMNETLGYSKHERSLFLNSESYFLFTIVTPPHSLLDFIINLIGATNIFCHAIIGYNNYINIKEERLL